MIANKVLFFLSLVFLVCSCAVTNNLYVNDPVPSEKDVGTIYLGIGSGLKAGIDSIYQDSSVNFPYHIDGGLNVYLGGQAYLADKLDFRFSVHFPYLIGGLGLRFGAQYSLFEKESNFNMAFGTDLGAVAATDFFFENLEISIIMNGDIYAESALNADFFIPMSYNFNQNTRLVITPRYSFNRIQIRENSDNEESLIFSPKIFSLAVGLKMEKLYFEFSSFQFLDKYYFNVGMAYVIPQKKQN